MAEIKMAVHSSILVNVLRKSLPCYNASLTNPLYLAVQVERCGLEVRAVLGQPYPF